MSLAEIRDYALETGCVPLGWAGSTSLMDYLNLGDALSPVMVALGSGLGIDRIPTRSRTPRIAAVGTIGHSFEGGTVAFWGTGCSRHKNPSGTDAPIPYTPPPDTQMILAATRGPYSADLLTGTSGSTGGVYGDPVWLLPRFYDPTIEKRWEVGVILHLAELTDRAYEAHPNPAYERYKIPPSLAKDIRLINTVTPVSAASLKERLDEMLACKRIVSTSLHGMVIAESYGIPCLYLAARGRKSGLDRIKVARDAKLDLRILDLYAGLGLAELDIYVQPRSDATDWADLIAAIDRAWQPRRFDGERLIDAFPLDWNPLVAPPGRTIFEHPTVRGLTLRHDVAKVVRRDEARKPR